MYSQHGTVEAILAFYQQLIKHPYLDESALKIPPASGWDTVDAETLQALGKTDAVIDLLRHLPYLDGRGDGYLIAFETIPVDFTETSTAMTEEVYPIPGHCVYLTEGLGREGYRLILDTERGTTTAFSIMEYELSMSEIDKYKHLPETEQWRAHRTLPTTEFFAGWTLRYERLVWFMSPRPYLAAGTFHSRVDYWQQEEELCHQELTKWSPDLSEAERIEDDDVYNTYLRYGWGSESFDKQACRVALLELEKDFRKERRRLMDLNDPDADMFD
ncbi:hypothetical protein KCU81_g8593, partial [Aureobasidium melanogenum]|uniref:Uncharacterized protein n=1 Tax=Aureobasidium melanogenum (strain CBS 110374) TaxID=1043003 RepID=A0A074VUJ9_AURM1